MLSIKPLTGGGGGDVHSYLAQGDYYSEQDRVSGEWFGRGAKMLGLSGQMHVEDFENIRQFNHPHNCQFLRAHHGKNNLYDLCFSAPKSVSIMARLGKDGRLDKAHPIAVKEALKQIERETVCKIQKDKRYGERKTDCLIAAVFMHDTSRELDPQLHSHCAVANMTFDAGETAGRRFMREPSSSVKPTFRKSIATRLPAR
jgi:conjugative relaxase-like TrwC/TraI family protein